MAPKMRAPRDANAASKVLSSVETDGDPASPLDKSTIAETEHRQRYKSWTPKPPAPRDPRNEQQIMAHGKESMAWYRKRLGKRWVELYEARESKKDHLKDPLKFYDMLQEMVRIECEKHLTHKREKKAALRRAYIPNIFFPLSDTGSGSASPLRESSAASDNTSRIPFSEIDSDKLEPMPEDP